MPQDITYMWNLKCDELIYEAERDSQAQKTNLWLPEGKEGGRGINQEFQISRYKLFYLQNKQQGTTVYRGELYSIFYKKKQ